MPKTKLSVTVDARLVEELDELARDSSRSQIVERALTRWLQETRRRRLEDEIERYYLEMTEEERAEDWQWADVAERSIKRTWS